MTLFEYVVGLAILSFTSFVMTESWMSTQLVARHARILQAVTDCANYTAERVFAGQQITQSEVMDGEHCFIYLDELPEPYAGEKIEVQCQGVALELWLPGIS